MPTQQFDAQFLFQRLECVGDRRLGNLQTMGGRREAAQFGHQRENLELSEGHEFLLILR